MSEMMMAAMDLSGAQDFDTFMSQFGDRAIMPQNGDPRILFTENINLINSMNVLFLEGELTYSLAVNEFAALSFEEFTQKQSGMGAFTNNFNKRPEFDNQGILRQVF